MCRDAAIARQAALSPPGAQQPDAIALPDQGPAYTTLMARAAHHALVSAVGDAHPTFCGSARLLKRWLQRQLLGAHIGDEASELLCAAAYTAPCVSPAPGECPSYSAVWPNILRQRAAAEALAAAPASGGAHRE